MTRQFEPAVVAPIPPEIIALGSKNANVVINWRLDEWSNDTKEQLKNNPEWRKAVGPNLGLLVSPMLTDYILDVPDGERLAILSQDSLGLLNLQIGTLFAIRPVVRNQRIHYGVNAELLLTERKHLRPEIGGSTLASHILAIACVPKDTRLTVCKNNPEGRFVSVLS